MLESNRFICAQLIRKCRNTKDLLQGKRVHARIVEENALVQDRFIANLLVEMYGKCGSVQDARAVFDGISEPNLYSWTNMFAAYAQNGHLQEATDTFGRMPEKDQVSWNAMIQAYTRNGFLEEAKDLFHEMLDRDVVSWTTVLAAYAQKGHLGEAKMMFVRMPQWDLVSWNAMMQAFVQNGSLVEACGMFDGMPGRDVASWTTTVAAHAQNRHLEAARRCFEKMPKQNVMSWTTIVVAHAQNGDLPEAGKLFARMPERNLVAWNAMIQAYAQNGHAKVGLKLFSFMELEGVKPNDVTFISVLTACSHIGLVEIGHKYFTRMTADHAITPTYHHLCCLIDLLGRAGWLAEAEDFANCISVSDVVVWKSLLGACKLHGDTERGARIAKRILEFDPGMAAPYVILSSIYAQDEIFKETSEDQVDEFSIT